MGGWFVYSVSIEFGYCLFYWVKLVNILDVEKTITNVTIKDAPYEVSDCYIATQMMKYGEVIPGSVNYTVSFRELHRTNIV
jgi:hypothetical protein